MSSGISNGISDGISISVLDAAPVADPARARPVAARAARGQGAEIILFSFAPGQSLPDHQAAHPIIVQCVRGQLDFSWEGQTVRLELGTVVHLRSRVVHRVDCPADASEEQSILLLTMITGEDLHHD